MSLRDQVRALTPNLVLTLFRRWKKRLVRKQIQQEFAAGNSISKAQLIADLKNAGLESGDDVLVHCSLSKLGAVDGGPKTLINALLSVIGPKGTLLMPTSPNGSFQLDYVKNTEYYDVDESPSALGAVSEYFRKMSRVVRSMHPTEPVAALGPKAVKYTRDHALDKSPYGKKSPYYKLAEERGKILYIGVTLANAGTSLHVLEEVVNDFIFPVYMPEAYPMKVRQKGVEHMVEVLAHNPEQSKKRRCDELLPAFEKAGVAKQVKIGKANTWVFDAHEMLHHMIREYETKKVTMYTPYGWPEK